MRLEVHDQGVGRQQLVRERAKMVESSGVKRLGIGWLLHADLGEADGSAIESAPNPKEQAEKPAGFLRGGWVEKFRNGWKMDDLNMKKVIVWRRKVFSILSIAPMCLILSSCEIGYKQTEVCKTDYDSQGRAIGTTCTTTSGLFAKPCPRNEKDEAASIDDYLALYEDVRADGRFGELPSLDQLDWSFSVDPLTQKLSLRIVSDSQEAVDQILAALQRKEIQEEGWWAPWWPEED